MASYFMRQFQPKVLFIFGTFSTSVCMVLIGIFAYLQEYFPYLPYLDTFSWMPVLSVIVTVIARATCILTVIHSVMSEVFPTEIRTQSIGLVESFSLSSGALCMKFFSRNEIWNEIAWFVLILWSSRSYLLLLWFHDYSR